MEDFEKSIEEKINDEIINEVKEESTSTAIAKETIWNKFKRFLFQEIVVTITPKQEQILKSIHDFWYKEVDGKKVKRFMFRKT